MFKKALKWLRQHYYTIVNSIAFFPAIIVIGFLALAYFSLEFDFSETGRRLKENIEWLSLRDSSTARTIIATIAAGIISLAVFSFSMVMILLNQAAVNMSNRILDSMIGNRYHQVVLGFYIGTIVYAFFILSTIRDIDAGLSIPALSVYLLILLTVADIFQFIYFLHYITQSVKYDTIINQIHRTTLTSMKADYTPQYSDNIVEDTTFTGDKIYASRSGYLQGFASRTLTDFCAEHNYKIAFSQTFGTYVMKGYEIATIDTSKPLSDEHRKYLNEYIDIYDSQNNISQNPYIGCKQLAEVAVKALSPGVNDPGTAVLSLNRLCDLLLYRMSHRPHNVYKDAEDVPRVITRQYSFEQYFAETVNPIWDYGRQDRMVQNAMLNVLQQLDNLQPGGTRDYHIKQLLQEVKKEIKERER